MLWVLAGQIARELIFHKFFRRRNDCSWSLMYRANTLFNTRSHRAYCIELKRKWMIPLLMKIYDYLFYPCTHIYSQYINTWNAMLLLLINTKVSTNFNLWTAVFPLFFGFIIEKFSLSIMLCLNSRLVYISK